MRRTIVGKVLGPDGEPATKAAVFWIGQRNLITDVPLPMDQDSRWATRIEMIARDETDADGAFCLSADYEPDRYQTDKSGDIALLAKRLEPACVCIP